ncbi:MAG TPA: MBL fold metallo-hydrolase [Blastocatellia bacterium]|nr:MBL fold metallo-hydrolase [Blastocatellia bacterium]
MAIKYVKSFIAELEDEQGKKITQLLWGDPIHVVNESGERAEVKARGRQGFLAKTELSDKSLLEVYVIDVGQGDGVLIKTPDGKWHLIDAGVAARAQMTKKGAANFLRWKFQEDLREESVVLENIIISHSDFDHYGGLVDVLSGRLFDGRTFPIQARNLYHCGIGRFKEEPRLGALVEGEVAPFPQGSHGPRRKDKFITELLDDKNSFANPAREFEGSFAEFAALAGSVPQVTRRLSHRDGHLPGYAPGDNEVVIHILGPILEAFASDRFGLREWQPESITRNGHSVVLRFDLGRARILLTGDLNTRSQQLLLSYHPAAEFAVDVAKGCHHGSEDVSLDFVKAMKARATVISSGDSEDFSHPRPLVLGASARFGRESRSHKNELLPPLLYSTELARSVKLALVASVKVDIAGAPGDFETSVTTANTKVKALETGAMFTPLTKTPISTDLVYGLVNVRTDGEHILCGMMEESGSDFDVKVFKAGIDV